MKIEGGVDLSMVYGTGDNTALSPYDSAASMAQQNFSANMEQAWDCTYNSSRSSTVVIQVSFPAL